MEHIEVARFTVNGREFTEDTLNIVIPQNYKSLFEGKHFRDMHHLSMALMFASCAAEARYYHKPHLLEQNEIDLKATLEM